MNKKQFNQFKLDKSIAYVTNCIVKKYSYDEITAHNLVINSYFPDLLKTDPDYVLHYDYEYWADSIIEEEKKIAELIEERTKNDTGVRYSLEEVQEKLKGRKDNGQSK